MLELSLLDVVKASDLGPGQPRGHEILFTCPRHEDGHPSLSINPQKNKWVCPPCKRGGNTAWGLGAFISGINPADKAGMKAWFMSKGLFRLSRRIVCTYDYCDESGTLLFQVVRYDPKDFRQRRPDGQNGWIHNLDGVRRIPYRLQELIKADMEDPVFIPEGERDVETLRSMGLVATTNPMGAGKWLKEYGEYFKDRIVAILPDNDAPGKEHAEDVATMLWGISREIKIVSLPNLPPKGDVSDWHRIPGNTKEKLLQLRESASEWSLPQTANAESSEDKSRRKQSEQSSDLSGEDWPDPSPIPSEVARVTPLEIDWIPESLRPWLSDVAERMDVPIEYPTSAAISALSIAVGRRAYITPMKEDDTFQVVPNLWGGAVGRPGAMKSPAIREGLAPLYQLEQKAQTENKERLQQYKAEIEKFNLRKEGWKKKGIDLAKKGLSIPDFENEEPAKPPEERFISNDPTIEKLHEILAENPAGVMVFRDELTGWLANLEKKGREGERSFYLETWEGNGSFSFDRIVRGSKYVEGICCSLFGGIQPARLRNYLADAISGGPGDDGLIQRFQLLVWPDNSTECRLQDRPPDAPARNRAFQIFVKLSSLVAPFSIKASFDDEAYEMAWDWRRELENRLRKHDLPEYLESHLSKYRSLMPSLALLFHLADWAVNGGNAEIVSLKYAKLAAAWCSWLETHAVKVYSSMGSSSPTAALALAEKISNGQLTRCFGAREVYLKGWKDLGSSESVKSAAKILAEHHWLRIEYNENTGGAPATLYRVNPKVTGQS